MSVNSKHPDYLLFLKNERKTLTFVKNSAYIAGVFPDLATAASSQLDNFPRDKFLQKMDYDFSAAFAIEVEGAERTILVETILRPGFSQLSYAVSMCNQTQAPYSVMRKFHFDYASPHVKTNAPKPIYHIQYGGEATPGLQKIEAGVDSLLPWLSVPRINHCPLNLALTLDMIFCEFRCEATNGLTETHEWRNFIKENEDFMLVEYYKNFSAFLNHHSSKYLIRDFCYGK